MPEDMRVQLQNTWRRIQGHVPGTDFNFAFWSRCEPRRSTYPACRAVIAARKQDSSCDEAMTLAIQQAYYQQARNPSDSSTLMALAVEIGLDKDQFIQQLESVETVQALIDEIQFAHRIGVRSFPSLVLDTGGGFWPISVEYRHPQAVLENIHGLIDSE
jgi:putative protein-disulfide isomerase